MKESVKLCHSRAKVLPNRYVVQFSDAPMSEGSESIRPLQDFEYTLRLPQLFQPIFPASISAALAKTRYSRRTVFDAGRTWVCALASSNFLENDQHETRGFTSCIISTILRQMNLRLSPTLSFSHRRVACSAGIAKYIRHAAFQPFQQKFQCFQSDILLTHFHSMKR